MDDEGEREGEGKGEAMEKWTLPDESGNTSELLGFFYSLRDEKKHETGTRRQTTEMEQKEMLPSPRGPKQPINNDHGTSAAKEMQKRIGKNGKR